MIHNYVSISFPQKKMNLSADHILQIKRAIENQMACLLEHVIEAITVTGRDDLLSTDAAMKPLQKLQDFYLPEGWFDHDLNYDLGELIKYIQSSHEPAETQDLMDELGTIFWCIGLDGSDGEDIFQRLNAELDKLVELSDNGLCHAITSQWIIGSAEPKDHDDISKNELWRQIHRVAALPPEVRQLLKIGLPDSDTLQLWPPTGAQLSLH